MNKKTAVEFVALSRALETRCRAVESLAADAKSQPCEWSEFTPGSDLPEKLQLFAPNFEARAKLYMWDDDIAGVDGRSSDIAKLDYYRFGELHQSVGPTAHCCCAGFDEYASQQIWMIVHMCKLTGDSREWKQYQWDEIRKVFAGFEIAPPYDLIHLIPRLVRERAMLKREYGIDEWGDWNSNYGTPATEAISPLLENKINAALDRLGEDATKDAILLSVKGNRQTVFRAIDVVKLQRKERDGLNGA